MAVTSGIKVLKTPYHAKRPNAICERFLGSVRRECLDHLLILSDKRLHRVLHAYIEYFNRARPHQGIHQQVPERAATSFVSDQLADRIISVPILVLRSLSNDRIRREETPSQQGERKCQKSCK